MMKSDKHYDLRAALDKLLQPELYTIERVRRRQLDLQSVVDELERVSKGKTFLVWGELQWASLRALHDVLIVDFASWVRGTTARKGLLGQIQAHFLNALRRKPPPLGRNVPKLRGLHEQAHSAAYWRLFPEANKGFPRPDDMKALKERVWNSMKGIVADRDKNRSHRFEHRDQKGSTADMIGVSELGGYLDIAQELLGDLVYVAKAGQFKFAERSTATAVHDMVDLVVLGCRDRQRVLMDGKSRDEFYRCLHNQHAARPPNARPWFNEPTPSGSSG